MKKSLCLALLVSVGVTLSGCGDSSPPGDQKNAKSAAPAPQKNAGGAAWDEKAQKYIRLNNDLIRFLAKRQTAEALKKGNFKEIRSDSWIFGDSFVKNLKAAIELPGAFPVEVDDSAKKLLAAIEKYVPAWNQLREYNKSKKYEDDGGAKGKELLAVYIEGIEALQQAGQALDKQVDLIAKEAHQRALAEYKKTGRLLEMHTLEAMGAAEKIIEMFDSTADFKDQAKIDAANAQLALMETSLEAMKAEHAKRKEKNPKSLPTIDRYNSIHEKLVAFAGAYRESRKQPSRFNDAVKEYNKAVEEKNRM
ncbi:MAG: YiiG family protein [Candidatus Accumulibacter sp.]|jgi:hypothetical protein|nr:YiiG family protein [Accumulibacter sp.]